MKKTLITSIALLMVLSTWSQDRFAVGLKVGTTSTQYTTENISSPEWPNVSVLKNDAKTGYLIGAFARLKLLGNLSLQPEMYYAKKSGKTSFTEIENEPISQDITYHTWDIPILANYNLIDLKVAKVYAITGPVMSFIAKDVTSFPNPIDPDSSIEDNANKATWAYQLGGGVEVWKFSLDCRYEWGLSNVSDGISQTTFNRKGNMLTFALGFKLIGL